MTHLLDDVGRALVMAVGMFWQTGWSLVLGFAVSGLLQAIVPADQMRRALGRSGLREIAIATLAGAASSSCSYASAAIMRTLFKKGASFVASIAFLFASTNLGAGVGDHPLPAPRVAVHARGVGRRPGADRGAEPAGEGDPAGGPGRGGADPHEEQRGGHEHMSMTVEGGTWRERLGSRDTPVRVAQNFAMDWRMLWKDLAAGFLIGGFLTVFVPSSVWQGLFLTHASPWIRLPVDALIGPIVAMLTFVCSIGNVPLAAVLWSVAARASGAWWRSCSPTSSCCRCSTSTAATMAGAWRSTWARCSTPPWRAAALIVDLGFTALGLVPQATGGIEARVSHFEINYTFWLNLSALALAIWLFVLNRRHPMEHGRDNGGGEQASRT